MAEPVPSAIRAVFDRALELEAAGRDIVHLEIGRPHRTSPDVAVQAAIAALAEGRVHYTASRGLPELRTAIAAALRRRGLDYDPDTEIVVTAGGSEAVAAACLARLEPGDEAVIPQPCWPHYATHVALAGARPVPVPARAEDDFQPDVDALSRAIGPRTRMLIVSSPSNPSGAVFSRHRLEALAALARDHDLTVLSDEIYARFTYDGAEHVSIATCDGMRERTIMADSCSKTYAMTGWRVGFAASDAPLSAALTTIHQHLTVCAPTFAQVGAAVAFDEAEQFVEGMVAEYAARRDELVAGVAGIDGLELRAPQGAFYAFPRVTAPGHDGTSLARALLEEAGVACVPGAPFGAPDHLRLSYAVGEETLAEGLDRLRTTLGSSS